MPAYLTHQQLQRDLAVRDLTDPAAGPHAIQLLAGQAVHALAGRWGCEVRWCRGDRIVSIDDNYDQLGFSPADVTREARYTRYVSDGRLLRSHSTALVPPALRSLGVALPDDVLLACPGVVFRRDAIDRLHSGTPHQLDLWRITPRPMTEADLDEMVSAILDAVLPGSAHRAQPRVHPYTLHGRQVDVHRDGEWIELWECGLAHPAVLARAGLPAEASGLALGMGLDRLLMLVKDIPDIRILRSADPRITAQMTDLERYRPVSAMPAVRRDVSIAVGADDLAEDLGDRARDALGDDASAVEAVQVLSETPWAELPPRAVERLGARPGQKNLLVAIVLRDLGRTLTADDANEMRDRIYAALHQGTVFHWAARSPRGPVS
jgi:phenylalanyl-tRNA synthetase alpha chain